jgi:3-O-alpha-D-mannopyranosyl-alpha-D-mannopyranose xylosylphosphotransferase
MPYHVVNQYFESGTLPDEVPPSGPIDIVFMWVNSTSPEFSGVVKQRWEDEDLGRLNGERHWRDNGELRGAIHSAVHAFKDDLRKVHVISGDYRIDNIDLEQEEEDQWSIGQVPAWLNWLNAGKESGESGPQMKWHFHRDIFRLPREGSNIRGWPNESDVTKRRDVDISEDELEQEWQDLTLPTFNSFAIESRLGFVDGCHENL